MTNAGHPQSRPIVNAASGMTSRAGDILADIITPMVNVRTPRMKDMSTEEVLAQLAEAQAQIWKEGDVQATVGSLDVKALYPSLDVKGSAEMVANMVEQSNMEIDGANLRLAQTFLASNLTEDEVKKEGLQELLPSRVWKMRRRPGKTTPELSSRVPCKPPQEPRPRPQQRQEGEDSSKPTSKWDSTNPEMELTKSQKKKIISKVIKVACMNVFGNHCYSFKGVQYIQMAGGPIGLRLMSIVARVVMDRWMEEFAVKLDKGRGGDEGPPQIRG